MMKVGPGSINEFLKAKSARVAALPAPAPGLTVSPAVPVVPEPVSPLQTITSVAADGNGLLSEINQLAQTVLQIMQNFEKFGVGRSMQRKMDAQSAPSRSADIDYDLLAEKVAARTRSADPASVATDQVIDWTEQANVGYGWLLTLLNHVESKKKGATIAELIAECQQKPKQVVQSLANLLSQTSIHYTTSNASTASTESMHEKEKIQKLPLSDSTDSSPNTAPPSKLSITDTSSTAQSAPIPDPIQATANQISIDSKKSSSQ